MIESTSKELYEKFHEFYIAVIKHIICKITVTRDDGVAVDTETLHRVQEYCLAAFDELNYRIYQSALNEVNVPAEQTSLAVLSYTLLRVLDDTEILSIIQEKYKTKLPEEEFYILGALFDGVSHHLYDVLSSSCKFLMATHDIFYKIKE